MQQVWTNWSGSLKFSPGARVAPQDEAELINCVHQAREKKQTLRVVGKGHSSSPLVETDGYLISLDRFQGLVEADRDANSATMRSGMTLEAAGKALLDAGLAMHNQGDVNVQTVVGAIATGTHGSGRKLQNLSSMLVGGRLVNGLGEVVEISEEQDAEFLEAARVSLGTLGVFTEIKLRLLPAFRIHRQEYCTYIEECLDHLEQLSQENRNFDFYWYPRSDEAKIRLWNITGDGAEGQSGTASLPYARLVEDEQGWSYQLLSKERTLKFDEMEYALPLEAGEACFQEIRKRMKEQFRRDVGWRVLYRFVAADTSYLSPAYGRETVTISLHQNASLPYQEFFDAIEPVFISYGGRPHWGKKHSLRAADLRSLYPQWDNFQEVRQRMDPEGVFLTPYLKALLSDS